jgi:hypothetical protein
MKKVLVVFGLVAGSAWGQITWTKAWTGPTTGTSGTFYNGYHDIHYDPFTNQTWVFSTDTTAGTDSIYSSRLHYFNSSAGTDTLVGTSNQPANGGCLSSSATWPYSHHPVGQIWIDSIRHRLWLMEGVGCTFIYPEQWYYQLDNPISGHTNWVQVHPPHLPTQQYQKGPNGVGTSTLGGSFNNASVVHDTDHDAFLLFGYDGGSNSHSTQVYCDTSQNPSPGTLTAAQQSVGCANADDWTDITSQTKCASGSTCLTAGGAGWVPPGYYYPNLEYDSVHHQVIQFAGLYGAYTVENQTWIYNMVTKTWTNMNPANPPANSSANNENGRVAHAFNTSNGKYYYHLTANTPQSGNPPASPPQDWVYDPVANTWTELSTGQGPFLSETMTYSAGCNCLIAWAAEVDSNGIYDATGIAEMWVGTFGAAIPIAPVIISTSPLTQAAQNSAYSVTLSATGSAPMTWTLTSGTLPSGLALSTSGVLSGTPTGTGTSTFAVQVANSAGTAGPHSFSLTVASQAANPPTITSTPQLTQGTQNTAYSSALSAAGSGPITWSLISGTLPAGLSLSGAGVLSGTPAASGSYTFSVTAINSFGASVAQSLTLTIAAPSGPSGLSVPITVQEALYPGSVTGVTRTNEPFCQGMPLADSAAITGTNAFGLTGASAGQFRMLGAWPSGNYKWVEVCGIVPNVSAGGTASVTLTNTGSGNFGGPNLATDNGTTITVSTGAATFTIKKANFNGVDQVVVGSTTVVASGSSQGLVVTGPNPTAAYPANVTCGSGAGQSACTTVYSSANDPNSTCAVEKNGPVEAVIKCTGNHVDSAGHIYMHFTVREYFYNGRTNMKITSELRNADYGTSGTFATAYKGHQGYELRIVPNISGTLNYTIANHTGAPSTGTMSGTDSVYLYQGESQLMKWQDWCGSGCVPYTTDTGYSIVKNGSTIISGTDTQYPQGWADISNTNGVGVEIGVYQLSAYWPKSLEFNSGGTDVRIGIWARENSQPYYQSWPQQSTHDLYLNFHAAAPASPANEFLKFQHYLVARAAYTYYNSTSVFPYTLIDSTVEDNYYTTAGSTANPAISASAACCILDFGISNPQWPLSIFRYYYWHDGGGGNQTEFRWSYLLNFITRGMTGRYLQAAHFYRFLADSAWPRADGFAWRNQPHANTSNPQVDGFGFPTATSANSSLAMGSANWIDQEHGHWYGLPDYYMMTGDETIHDGLLDGPKDWFLNPDTYQNGSFGGLWNSRAVGVELMGASRFSTFLTSTGDSDAPTVLTQGANDYLAQVNTQLCVSGFPTGCTFGPIQPSGSWVTQGISRTRGLHYGGTSSYLTPWCGNNNAQVRGAATFMTTNLIQGILELRNAEGSNWSEYTNSLDLAYGISRWSLSEMFVDDGSGNWEVNGFRYYVALDLSATCGGTQDPHTVPQAQQTVWFSFLPKYLVDGDTSWAGKFKIGIQRDEAAIGTTTSDFGAYSPAHMMTIINNPTTTVLNNVPITSAVANGGGSYTVSWTVPSGAQSYRIKWGPLQIVDWIGFDPINNVFTGDPVHTMAWFAATNAPNIPAPAAAGTTQSLTINTGAGNLTAANFSVKAYVASAGGGGGGGQAHGCDLNGDGVVNVVDVQLAISQALGTIPCGSADLIGNGTCTVVDVQRVISAALGGTCQLGP